MSGEPAKHPAVHRFVFAGYAYSRFKKHQQIHQLLFVNLTFEAGGQDRGRRGRDRGDVARFDGGDHIRTAVEADDDHITHAGGLVKADELAEQPEPGAERIGLVCAHVIWTDG